MRRLDDSLLIATHNLGKFEEFTALLEPLGIATVFAKDRGLVEPAETGSTFIENARIKAHAAAEAAGLPALSDDSGIEIDALGGAPGVYTADWAETPSGRDFVMAMEKSHRLLVESGAPKPWRARFCCTLVLAWPDGEDFVFEGRVEGVIVWPMRGKQGHGYDPIFLPDGHTQTFGEMDRWEKNRISHRAVALEKLVTALAS
jgi:XTP/dITP diphosphohydrolase